MITHPDGGGRPMAPAQFARTYLERALWEVGEAWAASIPADVLAAMTEAERRDVSEEIFHLIRMMGLSCGLTRADAAAMWSGGPEEYALRPRYCHPRTSVRLLRVCQEPEKYAIQLANADTGEFIQSLSNLGLQAAMEAGAAMAYSEHWLGKIGIAKGHGEC